MARKVSTSWVQVAAGNGQQFDAYLALPPAGSGPGIVLFQEIFGVNSHIQGVAEQYAQDGFVVLAPDIFWRQQKRVELGYEGAERDRAIEMMKACKPDELQADIRSSVAALRARGEVQGKVGAIGYCMGGRMAYFAAAITDVDAAVAYYGGGIHDNLQVAPQVQCPIQFHYASEDAAIPLAAVDKVREAMAGKDAEVHIYDGATHGFNCWDRASYNPKAASVAHGRSLVFFGEKLFG
jgi:carboxymethylenebutenolidase